ncbi:MAG: protoheme IX farnesyltransferase [Euryarchaeota archaeon]|nr:protoheme IX farnesyltransferase [Euryarchaeota archaeon]
MKLRTWALLATLTTFLLMVVGAVVVKTGAGLSCPDWPQCNGQWTPPFPSPKDAQGDDLFTQNQILSEYTHRLLAAVTGLFTLGLVVVTFRRYRDQSDLLTLGVSATGLLFAQILMGAATVRLGNAPWSVAVHQALAVAFFGVLVALLTLAWRRESTPATTAPSARLTPAKNPEPRRNALQVLGDYLTLMKPRVLILLLLAAVTSMLIAVGPHLDPWTIVATVLGGAMASGSGSAFNQWWERDLDGMMSRTATRPVASGRIPEHHVLAFSASMALGSFMVLAVFVNLLAASLALAGALFYVVVYTLWLKRLTAQNIVIGGAAGSFPALVGWAAATGTVEWPALVLGFIVFLWTPPHFWSFALVYKQDYARANVPMLPVVRGDEETKQQIFLYSVALFLTATSLWFFHVVSDAWFVFSLGLSGAFVVFAFLALRDATTKSAYRLFRFSILWLGLYFLSLAVDRIVSSPL